LSYDIDFLRLSGTGDLAEEAKKIREANAMLEENGEGPKPDRGEDERRHALITDLLTLSPSLRMEPYDKGFSYGCVVTADGSGCHIPDIYIGIGSGFITFPYSADFDNIFPEVRRVVAVFAKHGYVAYDPQTETLLTSPEDFGQSASAAQSTRDTLLRTLQERGEIVIGSEQRTTWSFARIGVILLVVVGLASAAVKFYLSNQTPRIEIRDLRAERQRILEEIRRFKQTPPSTTLDSDASSPVSRRSQTSTRSSWPTPARATPLSPATWIGQSRPMNDRAGRFAYGRRSGCPRHSAAIYLKRMRRDLGTTLRM